MDVGKITLDEAAKRLESTPMNVLMHIKRGLLTGEEIGSSWFVEVASLENFLASHQGSSKENVCQSSCSHKCPSCG